MTGLRYCWSIVLCVVVARSEPQPRWSIELATVPEYVQAKGNGTVGSVSQAYLGSDRVALLVMFKQAPILREGPIFGQRSNGILLLMDSKDGHTRSSALVGPFAGPALSGQNQIFRIGDDMLLLKVANRVSLFSGSLKEIQRRELPEQERVNNKYYYNSWSIIASKSGKRLMITCFSDRRRESWLISTSTLEDAGMTLGAGYRYTSVLTDDSIYWNPPGSEFNPNPAPMARALDSAAVRELCRCPGSIGTEMSLGNLLIIGHGQYALVRPSGEIVAKGAAANLSFTAEASRVRNRFSYHYSSIQRNVSGNVEVRGRVTVRDALQGTDIFELLVGSTAERSQTQGGITSISWGPLAEALSPWGDSVLIYSRESVRLFELGD